MKPSPFTPRVAFGRLLLIPLLLALLSGCGEPEPITRYQVPKEKRIVAPPRGHGAVGPMRRMVAAIVLHSPKAWFFKITGPDAAVSQPERLQSFLKFIDSVKFVGEGEAAVPEWTLPEGWRREPGSQFRYATIQIGDDNQPLELAVSSLPLPEGDPAPYILKNINRWRGQLRLEPLDQIDPTAGVIQRKLPNRDPVTFVNIATGPASDVAGHPPTGQEQPPDNGQAAPLTYETPEGWKPGRTGGLRKAAFEISADGRKAEMTVIDLAPGAAGLLPNINRWRLQIQLGKMTQAQLDKQIQKIKVDGHPGHYIYLVGPEEAKPRSAMLGVIVVAGGRAWFLKLTGDAKLVEREKKRFEQFARSLRFAKS